MGRPTRRLSSNPQWCLKVLFGAALITLIIISVLGGGYHTVSRSADETMPNIDPTIQEKSSGESDGPKILFKNENNHSEEEKNMNEIVDSTDEKHITENKSNDFVTVSRNIHKKMQTNETLAPNIPREIFSIDRNDFQNKRGEAFPSLSDIQISNEYWQYFKITSGVDLYLFSAFYDHRKMFRNKAFVRVLAMVSHIDKDVDIFCKLWFKKKKMKNVTVIAMKTPVMYRKEPALNTYIITCDVSFVNIKEIPFAVSLVENINDKATNMLRIVNNELESDAKEDFAVCHKGLDFPFYDNSIKLVEWIELLRIMGASKIFLYEFNIHPNASKVLQYYTKEGLVKVSPLTLPGDQPNTPKELNEYLKDNYKTQLSHEKLPYNDCYFRNMNRYKYILNIDVDEMLIPKHTHTWKNLMHNIKANLTNHGKGSQSQYHFERLISLESMRNPHGYTDDIPKHMHMLQNIYRTTQIIKHSKPKTIFDTDIVISTTNHITSDCTRKCTHYNVPTDVAIIMHYRNSCKQKFLKNVCNPDYSVKDTEIWKYKDELISRTTNVLKKLELI